MPTETISERLQPLREHMKTKPTDIVQDLLTCSTEALRRWLPGFTSPLPYEPNEHWEAAVWATVHRYGMRGEEWARAYLEMLEEELKARAATPQPEGESRGP